jgi:hypothetical protein
MKKLFLILVLLVLFPATVFPAVGSWSKTSDQIFYPYGSGQASTMRVLIFTFTASSTDGTIPNLVLSGSTWTDGTNSGTLMNGPLTGWYGFLVEIDGNHAGTEPTENSEIYIKQNTFDLLNGNGVDQVDNTAERAVYFYIGSAAGKRPIYGDLTITVTQQATATNSATATIYIILEP